MVPVPAAGSPPAKKPTLVFEAHVGDRPADLAHLLEPLEDALETHGFAARPESIVRIVGGRVPRPGILDKGKTASQVAQRVNSGFAAYVSGKFTEAVGTLSDAIQDIHRNPGLFVVDTKNVDIVTRAYMALTISQARLGRTADSTATMAELIRIMRGQPISRADYGAEAEQLYRGVLKQVQALGRGRLTITAGDERAMIFVDGQLRGMGKALLGDLIPGRYRAFVQVPGSSGRQYALDVRADEETFLGVNAEIEGSLWVGDEWVGFQFTNETDRKQEARFASELARRWTGEGVVAVVGSTQLQGKPAVIGTLYRTDGTVLRSAVIGTSGADRDRLRSLAKFLADGTPGDGLDILSGERPESAAVAARDSGGRTSLLPKLVTAAGVAALGTGIGLYVIDEDPNPVGVQQPTYRDTAPAGVVLAATGLAAIGIGILFWLRQPARESGRAAVSIHPGGASVDWHARF